MCELEECNKPGKSEWKSTKGKNYCSKKHLVADGAVRSEEAKATKVSFKVCSLLFVLLCQLNYTLSPFVHFSTTNRSWQTQRTIPSTMPRYPRHLRLRERPKTTCLIAAGALHGPQPQAEKSKKVRL